MLPAIVAAIREVDPTVGTTNEMTMSMKINQSPSAYLHRSAAWLVGGFAGAALLLAVVGLYGVIAYSVGRRTREIGVRMALGAQRKAVYQLIMREAAWLAGIGIMVGLLGSVAAATLIRTLLFGVGSWDISTMVAVAALLAFFALLASYLPARRAAKVDPMIALRYE
jgi:ABC-type antimicrobial peptide transport system permease subunit